MNYTTWIEINRSRLEHNVEQYKSWLPANCSIAPVIKANAYGHGLYQVASIHETNNKISYLCVVNSQEALSLRKQKITKPILVLGYINSDLKEIIANKIEITVYDLTTIKMLNNVAIQLQTKVNLHLKIDTGMSRLGIEPNKLTTYLNEISSCSGVQLCSIWSHLSSGNNKQLVQEQEQLFKQCYQQHIPIHLTNSQGSLKCNFSYDFARIGSGLYGYLLTTQKEKQQALLPILSLKTKIVHIKQLDKNRHIGYQRAYTTTTPTTIAILAIGYDDGLDSQLAGKGKVILHGKYANILSINMNFTTIDITNIPDCNIHDTVAILGQEQNCIISAYDWQRSLHKNIRECLTNLESSLPRIIV